MIGSERVFIIAEAGVNHNGSLKVAKDLIEAACRAGADAVKFQTFTAEKIATGSAGLAEYQSRNFGRSESQQAMLKKLELDDHAHRELCDYCSQLGIMFLSTPFDESAVDLLVGCDVPVLKIGSGEITNIPFLQYAASQGLPVILSTGMSTLGETERAVATLKSGGCDQITLLHCVTEYPAPIEQVNLKAMRTLQQAFGLPVGYSDHTCGIEVAVAAAALGARVLEKHFTLDKTMSGPDHAASLDPDELTELVRAVRNVELALGDGIKAPAPCERANREVARKSIVVARALRCGETIDRADLAIKRPGTGIPPEFLEKVIGRCLRTDVSMDHVLQWEDLS